ncbi:hypothetical protein ACFXAZ_16850 [Streptomyces sp. NPDC059477]|uniref:hypothetical protein n=1 Tax=Streptomyces sp. NPDC059477 TaxID=3346847 RepID=UPI003697F063
MRRVLLTAGALATLAAVSGCTIFGQESPCTMVGMDSSVSVIWLPSDFGATDAATIRLCVADRCEERTSGDAADPFARLAVRLPDDIGAVTVPVRLTVTEVDGGRVVVTDARETRLTEEWPNGEGCAPVAWTATYGVTPGEGLGAAEGVALR